MKLIIVILLLLVFASAGRYNLQKGDALVAANQLGNAFSNAAKGQSSEQFSDYIADDFVYTYCDEELDKTQFVQRFNSEYPNGATNFTLDIRYATWGDNNRLYITAIFHGASISTEVFVIAQPNSKLIGKYDVSMIESHEKCARRLR